MERPPERPYILALDLGANSLGWVCLAAEPAGDGWEPTGLLLPAAEMGRFPTVGVRIFPEGVSDFDTGEEAGPGVKRRQARLMRRQTERRARRMRKTFRLLQAMGLLPSYPAPADQHRSEEARRDELLKALDRDLAPARSGMLPPHLAGRAYDLTPYLLRAAAVGQGSPLTKFELGRALYHLAQRRGFLSNRKDAGSDEKELDKPGDAPKAASGRKSGPTLREQMNDLATGLEKHQHTLGQHLLWLLTEKGQKIRNLKPRRYMYRREFESIWNAQAPHHPDVMTDEAKRRLYLAIFFQRPLKDQSDKVGSCSLEDGESSWIDEQQQVRRTPRRKRAPLASLIAERFTMVQRLNDARLLDRKTGEVRPFSADERGSLIEQLERCRSMSVAQVRDHFGWKKTQYDLELNFDDRTGAAFPGMWVNAQLLEIFGPRWLALTDQQREAVVDDLRDREDPEWYENDPDDPEPAQRDPVIVRAALDREGPWSLLTTSRFEAQQLVKVRMRSDRASHSKTAMRKLLRRMQLGEAYRTAVDKTYVQPAAVVRERLPKVLNVFRSVNNPVVTRSLTELRRVVNHLIPLYGKPVQIRIEVTREVKQGRAGRERIRDAQAENLKFKKKALTALCAELAISAKDLDDYSKRDQERIRLWQEQGHICPYTLKTIPAAAVCSAETEVDHILPHSRSQDDSFANKVLVFAHANQAKGQRTPRAAFEAADPEKWRQIEGWVASERKRKQMSRRKLDRILMTDDQARLAMEGFRARQLNDTGWASRWARKYLMTLYGGDIDQGIDPDGRRRVLTCSGEATADLRYELGLEEVLKRVIDPSVPRPKVWTKRIDQRHHIVDALAVGWFGPRMSDLLSKAAEAAPAERRRRYSKIPKLPTELEAEFEAALRACVPSYRIDNRVRRQLHDANALAFSKVASGKVKSFVEIAPSRPERRALAEAAGNHHMLVMAVGDDSAPRVSFNVVSAWRAAERVRSARLTRTNGAPYDRPAGVLFTLAIGDVLGSHLDRGVASSQARFVLVRQIWQSGVVAIKPIHETRRPISPPRGRPQDLTRDIPASGLLVAIGKLVASGCSKYTVSPIGVVRPCRA